MSHCLCSSARSSAVQTSMAPIVTFTSAVSGFLVDEPGKSNVTTGSLPTAPLMTPRVPFGRSVLVAGVCRGFQAMLCRHGRDPTTSNASLPSNSKSWRSSKAVAWLPFWEIHHVARRAEFCSSFGQTSCKTQLVWLRLDRAMSLYRIKRETVGGCLKATGPRTFSPTVVPASLSGRCTQVAMSTPATVKRESPPQRTHIPSPEKFGTGVGQQQYSYRYSGERPAGAP